MKVKKSYIWAGVITVAIAGWLASGELMSRTTPAEDKPSETAQTLFRVEVETKTAAVRRPEILIRGRTEAFRTVDVRARTAGIVETVPLKEGDRVKAGDLLCQLDLGSRPAKLAEEKARLASAELDLNAADKLVQQEFVSRTKQAAEKAKYDAAKASVEQMEREMGYTKVTAPIAGTIENRPAEPGSFLQVGTVCARVVVLDPMLVVGQVSERDIAKLKAGMPGSAKMITGEAANGEIRHIAPTADQTTRTFRVELEIPNPDLSLRDGVTSEMRIPLQEGKAHKFSPALLSLDDTGRIGVRIVTDAGVVKFVPVTILEDAKDGIWVAGLPETVTLITTGQEYVVDGQKVEPVFKQSSAVVESQQ